MREQKSVVAIVRDDRERFLVTYNAKWGGYAFPMESVPEGGDVLGSLAIRAVEHDLGCSLPRAVAAEFDTLSSVGTSRRTGEETVYEYSLYTVEVRQPLDLLAAPTWNENPPMFLDYGELGRRTDITWSTAATAREFVENQEVILSVVARPGTAETEYLMVSNANYGGYFFPSQRAKIDAASHRLAVGTVRSDLGYRGPAEAVRRGAADDVHFSNRFHRDRRYRFEICEVTLAQIDLHQPGNPLEKALRRRGKAFRWFPASRLGDRDVPVSPTLAAVLPAVLAAIPPKVLALPLRQSEGGIALIRRTRGGRAEWLAQWNDRWKAFFFVGGHREEEEIFRACVVREIGEELGLGPDECPVAGNPAHIVAYRALSAGTGELTEYSMELYDARPTPAALEKIAGDPKNKWLDETEIERMGAHDGRAVSPTMGMLLGMANLPGG